MAALFSRAGLWLLGLIAGSTAVVSTEARRMAETPAAQMVGAAALLGSIWLLLRHFKGKR